MRLVGLLFLLGSLSSLQADDQASLKYAEALWKANVRKQQGKINHAETANTLVLGTADPKLLDQVGKASERAVVYAKKSVGYDTELTKRPNQQMYGRPHQWEGKLLVIVCKERHEFADLFAKLKNAKPEASEVAAYLHEKTHSYVLLGPASTPAKINYEVQAVEMAGATTLTRRHDPVPRWLAAGFGHMLAYKFDSKGFAAERSKIPYLAAQHHVRELMMDDNPAIPHPTLLTLQASLVECLTQSPNLQDQWFQLLDETSYHNGNMQAALNELKVKDEAIQIEWKNRLWK